MAYKARGGFSGTTLPTYLGFAILGFVNATVPFVVYSANYLIIPYPRWVVLLIETLPALITKLVIPHVFHHVPYWMRPLTVGGGWIMVAIITKSTPPNIAPPIRIFTSALASISAAAMEVSFLGMMRYYGRAGLAGWGAGVGAGAVFCAVLPFVLTVWMESFLRDFIDCIYALTGAMLFAFFVVLPGAPVNYPEARQDRGKAHVEDGPTLTMQDPVEELSRALSTTNRVNLTKSMIRPFMVPLFAAFALQALAYPGISRALPLPPSTRSFSYFTSYALAFQIGSFISRTHTPLLRPESTRTAFTALGGVVAVLLVNATLLVFSARVVMGLLAFGAGLGGGAVYMIVMDKVLEETSLEPGIHQEFGLQVVGAGETSGVIVGGLLGIFQCDEQGPPCTNCATRGLEGCSYLPDPPAQLPATETRRRLELELMHRWSTRTFMSLVCIPEDIKWLQGDVPLWALKNEYLLNGMFAFVALEIGLCGDAVMDEDPVVYVKLALEYYDKASRAFRAQLENVTPENVQKMFMFSFLAVGVNMALAQCEGMIAFEQNILERMVALWELLMGNASIADRYYDVLISGALSQSTEALLTMTAQQTQTPVSLPSETEAALERLSAIIEKATQLRGCGSSDLEAHTEDATRTRIYRSSFAAIKTCFEVGSKDIYKGAAIGFPAMAGREFGVALKKSDPVAMFLMMHWGVQLHSLGKLAWWVGSFGQKMVRELSGMLWESDLGVDAPGWRENITWARIEVELMPMGGVTPEEDVQE
ncbi:hypothetical protein N0V84_003934 [Fusarium piperis]|uniref:Uncharacterized protein n=1 Tax=Fusarium piperis TaxID=1435070 RepID=A0A9W9BRQ0_9HYPO|nr:hypothetical protein N0V84_003934 [Fusarium piperis]